MYVIAQNRERDYAAVSNTGERKGCSGVKERGNIVTDDLEQRDVATLVSKEYRDQGLYHITM